MSAISKGCHKRRSRQAGLSDRGFASFWGGTFIGPCANLGPRRFGACRGGGRRAGPARTGRLAPRIPCGNRSSAIERPAPRRWMNPDFSGSRWQARVSSAKCVIVGSSLAYPPVASVPWREVEFGNHPPAGAHSHPIEQQREFLLRGIDAALNGKVRVVTLLTGELYGPGDESQRYVSRRPERRRAGRHAAGW